MSEATVGGTASRFKGRVYDPEQERADFSREFYEQAEALRQEMEVSQNLMIVYIVYYRMIDPFLVFLTTQKRLAAEYFGRASHMSFCRLFR